MPKKVSDSELLTERVLPNPLGVTWVLLIPPIAYFTFLPINEGFGLLLGTTITIAVLVSIFFSAPLVEVDSHSFSVSNAEVPISVISRVEVVKPEDAFSERGPKLNPSAFVKFQATVKPMLKVYLQDQMDPTPYWLISCRQAEKFEARLNKLIKNKN